MKSQTVAAAADHPKARATQRGLALAGVVLAALGRGAAESGAVVDWHRSIFFPGIVTLLQSFSAVAPTTAGEVVAALCIALAVLALLRRRSRVLGSLLFVLGLVVFGFYAFWGLAYRYPSLSTRLAPLSSPPTEGESTARLTELALRSAQLLARASAAAVSFDGSDQEFLARINGALDVAFTRWPASIEAAPVRAIRFGPAKASRFSFFLSRLQLAGYYFPWTGEAQINAEMPRTLWSRVGAHEKAHQRGFAREDEATVISVITGLASPDPTVFYGGTLGLFVGFDRELARVNPEARQGIWAGLPRAVIEHLQAETAFWKGHEGVAGAVSEKVNDTYLKSQGVRSGIASYGEGTRLILQALETPGLDLGRLLRDSP